MNSQPAPSQLSILNVILSSSVVVGTLTGVFYFAGGAYTEGYRHVLGLDHLAGLSSAEYIFAGAELLLLSSYALVALLGLVAPITGIEAVLVKWRIPRSWETPIFVSVIGVSSILLLGFIFRTMKKSRDLISSGSCPVTGHGAEKPALWLFCAVIVAAVSGFLFFTPRRMRLIFLVWGILASTLTLYALSWNFGAAELYTKFQIIKIGSTTLQLPSQALLLGSDDKNLVILIHDIGRTEHSKPMYVLRSEIKNFSIVGAASINDFVCNPK